MTSPPLVAVTQADRQAAAACQLDGYGDRQNSDDIIRGGHDGSALVQSFARHGISARQEAELQGYRRGVNDGVFEVEKHVCSQLGVESHQGDTPVAALIERLVTMHARALNEGTVDKVANAYRASAKINRDMLARIGVSPESSVHTALTACADKMDEIAEAMALEQP